MRALSLWVDMNALLCCSELGFVTATGGILSVGSFNGVHSIIF